MEKGRSVEQLVLGSKVFSTDLGKVHLLLVYYSEISRSNIVGYPTPVFFNCCIFLSRLFKKTPTLYVKLSQSFSESF